MWIIPWDPFLMKKLLKSEICGPWTVHDMHWLAENCLTSQTLRLLFMHSAWTVAITVKFISKRMEKKKKKKKTQTQTPDPNAHNKFNPNGPNI